MLKGRVLVAHNAPFDYGFLAQEFVRTGLRLPVEQRLCTLALNRRFSPATPDLKLAALGAGTTERTMLLAETYRRGSRWRLRIVGQGHDFGLAGLVRGFGVDVED